MLIQSGNLCIFPRGRWCAKFSVISPWSFYFEACRLRVIVEVLKFSGLNSLLWSIQFENICRSLSWKSLSKFLITIACDSLTLILSNIIPSCQGHRYLFRSMIRILKVESKSFCRRDGTRIVSPENSFARKQDW